VSTANKPHREAERDLAGETDISQRPSIGHVLDLAPGARLAPNRWLKASAALSGFRTAGLHKGDAASQDGG
jgi:hypothetical protein